jgi:hypothetical protein
MALSTLAELKTSITNWSKRDDLSAFQDDIILTAEKWILRHARTRDMETAFSVLMVTGVAALPTDFLAAKYLYIDGTPTRNLQMTSAAQLILQYPDRTTGGKPFVCAVDGASLIFGPFPDSAYTVKGTYFAKPASILSSASAFFLANPDLYLWASLAELEPFLKNDKRIGIWAAKRDQAVQNVNAEKTGAEFSGGALVMRVV